ncbi:hypothetical protein BH10PSE2_BH10PSE2_08630 [soil metagenome]
MIGVVFAGLTGCVGAFNPAVDASSPVAPRVQALVDAHRVYPRWENFPRSADALPTDQQLAQRVNTLRATGGALEGEVAGLQWDERDPDVFAREVQARIDSSQMSPATVRTEADIEAYAQTLRDRAKAPPPIDRRP